MYWNALKKAVENEYPGLTLTWDVLKYGTNFL